MQRFSYLKKFFTSLFTKSRPLGDLALLKVAAFYKGPEHSETAETLRLSAAINFRPLPFEELETYPAGSLGAEYFLFIQKNKLRPMNYSGEFLELHEKFPVLARYVRLHDFFHVLLGRDTSVLGEYAVYMFIEKQNDSAILNRAARTARWFTRIFLPHCWKQQKSIETQMQKLANQAPNLLLQPLEDRLGEPLEDLQREFQLK